MKKLFIPLFWLSVLAMPALAQEYKKAVKADQKVKILLNRSNMKVEGYNGSDLNIKATNYEQPPERAKGLRPLYNNAQDNTNIGLAVTEENGTLIIQEASSQEGEYLIRLPQNTRLSIEQINFTGEDIEVRDMKSEIEVLGKNAEIRLLNIQGPIIANSTAGDIVVVYSSVNQQAPHMISSVASEIDITLPATSKANLVLQSITGEIFTDMDIQLKKKNQNGAEMRLVGGGQTIEGTTNGGGTELGIKSISGNIYIRKGQKTQ